MQVEAENYPSLLKEALSKRSQASRAVEAELFSKAEALLSKRRERLTFREQGVLRRRQAGDRVWRAVLETLGQWVEVFAIHPNTPAAGLILAVLVMSFAAFNGTHSNGTMLRFSDLPELPKTNDAPARYDAQVLAEAQAYEREVQNAHQNTSGGI